MVDRSRSGKAIRTSRTIRNRRPRNSLFGRRRLCPTSAPRIQRMHAQSTRRAKPLTPKSTLLELRNQTIRLCPAPPSKSSNLTVGIYPSDSAQPAYAWKDSVVRMHTLRGLNPRIILPTTISGTASCRTTAIWISCYFPEPKRVGVALQMSKIFYVKLSTLRFSPIVISVPCVPLCQH